MLRSAPTYLARTAERQVLGGWQTLTLNSTEDAWPWLGLTKRWLSYDNKRKLPTWNKMIKILSILICNNRNSQYLDSTFSSGHSQTSCAFYCFVMQWNQFKRWVLYCTIMWFVLYLFLVKNFSFYVHCWEGLLFLLKHSCHLLFGRGILHFSLKDQCPFQKPP